MLVGGIWATGREEDAIGVLTDSKGNETSRVTIGGTSYERGTCVIPSGDKAYLLLGFTKSIGNGGRDILLVMLREVPKEHPGSRGKGQHRDLWGQKLTVRLPLPNPKGNKMAGTAAFLAAIDSDSGLAVLDIRSGDATRNDIWYVVRDGEVVAGLKITKVAGPLRGAQIVSLKPGVILEKGDKAVLYR